MTTKTPPKQRAKPDAAQRIVDRISAMLKGNAVDYEGTNLFNEDMDEIQARIRRAIKAAEKRAEARGASGERAMTEDTLKDLGYGSLVEPLHKKMKTRERTPR